MRLTSRVFRSRQYKVLDLDSIADNSSEHAPRVSKRQQFDDVTAQSTSSSASLERTARHVDGISTASPPPSSSSSTKTRRSVSDVTASLGRPRVTSGHHHHHHPSQAPRKSVDDSDADLSFNRVSLDLMQVLTAVLARRSSTTPR